MRKGQKLYSKAKKIILGGNMLLSKRPEMYLPNLWPSYFSKSEKVFLWDLDGKRYTDMIFAVGHNILGYKNKELDKSIFKTVNSGNMTTLNCPEEVYLTKKLLQIHSWAGMAKYARSGGEANALAIRIARAASKRDGVAICGYHGWHDWYLSTNLKSKKKLSSHLLDGLSTIGVPKVLKDTVHPFNYGDLNELKRIIKKKKIGVIKMEVCRNSLPDTKFLREVKKISKKNKIILIFDECTSGFRRNLGGIHMNYKIYPDIVMLGKALGNGYAITAVLGKKNIMKKAETSFISSTFWTERIGFVAALNTLKIMEKKKSWLTIIKNGKYIISEIKKIAKKYNLKISITGIETIIYISFLYKKNLEYKTFLTQEMLKKNYLASNQIFVSIYHTKKIVDGYIKVLEKVFEKISYFEKNNVGKSKFLNNDVCHKTFQRLTN